MILKEEREIYIPNKITVRGEIVIATAILFTLTSTKLEGKKVEIFQQYYVYRLVYIIYTVKKDVVTCWLLSV